VTVGATTSMPQGVVGGRGERLLAGSAWVLFGLGCVFYAALAFDYFLALASGRDGWWLRLFAALVGEGHARGAGSVHVDQAGPYGRGLHFMLMHTTTGAIALALGPSQFMAVVRRRWPRFHRDAGRIYLVSALLSMVGGLAYLGTTPPAQVFSGVPFAWALVGLDLAVLASGALAYTAIRGRDLPRHRAWMALNFGLLLATPGLRLLWVLFAWLVPDWDQARANLGIMTFLLPLCMSFMLAWLALQPATPAQRAPLTARADGPLLILTRVLAAAAALALLAEQWPLFRDATTGAARLLVAAYVVAALVCLASLGDAVLEVVRGRRAGSLHARAAVMTALAGALAAQAGSGGAGGTLMLCYWWGLAALWLVALASAEFAGRRARTVARRDWLAMAAALALLPLVRVPLDYALRSAGLMTPTDAALTAATLAFAGQYLVAAALLYGPRGAPALASAGGRGYTGARHSAGER